jgi:hypothetical protein
VVKDVASRSRDRLSASTERRWIRPEQKEGERTRRRAESETPPEGTSSRDRSPPASLDLHQLASCLSSKIRSSHTPSPSALPQPVLCRSVYFIASHRRVSALRSRFFTPTPSLSRPRLARSPRSLVLCILHREHNTAIQVSHSIEGR